MAAEGLPPDRVPQDMRRQALSQLEEAIRNYPGPPPPNQSNHTEVESRLFDQSRNADEYTSKVQKILFMVTKRKSQQNLAAQNSQQQSSGPPSLPQSSSLQQQQQQQQQQLGPGGGVSYSAPGSNMAGMNPATGGMGMNRPMQPMPPGAGGGAGGGYQGYQVGATQMHPAQHPHYPPHMHGMGGMQSGMHPAQRPPMIRGGGGPGMMHGGGHQTYGHAHNPIAVQNYPQNYQSHYNPPISSGNPMAMGQRQSPSINPSLIRQQPPMGGLEGGMMPPGGQAVNMVGVERGGMMGVGGVGGMAGRGVGGGGRGYGGQVMQPQPPPQTGYTPDMNGIVQNVTTVPNPSYLPASSASGARQPAQPYDPLAPPASSGAPSNPASSAAPPISSSSSPSSQSQASHPPSSSSSVTTTTTTPSTLLQPVPSPAPPTPVLPASPATSVGSPAHSTVTPEENEAYLRTHHELQKYVPLLNRMMNRMLKKDGEEAYKSEQYMKLKSLYSLLQDDKKRVPLPTLIKCKTALEKMFEQQQFREHLDSTSSQPPPSNPPSVTPAPLPPSSVSIIDPPLPPTTKPLPEPKSQSLLEFKMISSPTATLSGGVSNSCNIEAYPFPADRLPPSKRLCNRVEPTISPGLRREIAHLVGFKVQPVSKEKVSSGTMLECHIVDEDLPTVPSLTVCIPPGYPNTSPECNLDSYLNSTPLLTEVGRRLSDTLARCCSSYTLSFLLSSWETSLLKALASQF